MKLYQPCLIEFSIKNEPVDFIITANTHNSGYSQQWFIPLNKSTVIKNTGGNYAVLWVPTDYDSNQAMDNTAIIRVLAFWDAEDNTNKTTTDSKPFSILQNWDSSVKAVPGDNVVSLSWDPVLAAPGKVSYTIMRRIAGGEWKSITDFPINESVYTDNTVKNFSTYEYQVAANVLSSKQNLYENAVAKPTNVPSGTLIFTMGSNIIKLNGADKQIDSPPVVVNGRTFVPIRALVENIGGTIGYNPDTEEITINYKTMTLVMQIGNTMATLNNTPVEMDVAPYISAEGRTMIPLRFVSENFGLNVIWHNDNQSIEINF
jgi:hypothetical protein